MFCVRNQFWKCQSRYLHLFCTEFWLLVILKWITTLPFWAVCQSINRCKSLLYKTKLKIFKMRKRSHKNLHEWMKQEKNNQVLSKSVSKLVCQCLVYIIKCHHHWTKVATALQPSLQFATKRILKMFSFLQVRMCVPWNRWWDASDSNCLQHSVERDSPCLSTMELLRKRLILPSIVTH